MATFTTRQLADGTIRHKVSVRLRGISKPTNRTFGTLKEAQRWAAEQETQALQARAAPRWEVGEPHAVLQAGVYILWSNRQVAYVGSSNDILQRLQQHRKQGREFDQYSVIQCEANEMLTLERRLIQKYKPPLNIIGLHRRQRDNRDRKAVEREAACSDDRRHTLRLVPS